MNLFGYLKKGAHWWLSPSKVERGCREKQMMDLRLTKVCLDKILIFCIIDIYHITVGWFEGLKGGAILFHRLNRNLQKTSRHRFCSHSWKDFFSSFNWINKSFIQITSERFTMKQPSLFFFIMVGTLITCSIVSINNRSSRRNNSAAGDRSGHVL